MAELDLEEIEARLANATRGPWRLWDGWGPTEDGLMGFARLGPEPGEPVFIHEEQRDLYATRADAEFIATARTDVPALVAEVRRLRQFVGDLAAHGVAVGLDGFDPDEQTPYARMARNLVRIDEAIRARARCALDGEEAAGRRPWMADPKKPDPPPDPKQPRPAEEPPSQPPRPPLPASPNPKGW